MSQALAAASADHDFVLIDCPPSLSLLTLNGLASAHGVVVPMQCEYFALEGLSDLVNTIKQVHANLNKDLKIIGLLRVMFDPRITLQQQVSEQLKAIGMKVRVDVFDWATAINQRSDVCAVPAAAIVAEAMVALVLAEALTEKFGGDSITEIKRNIRGYLDHLVIS